MYIDHYQLYDKSNRFVIILMITYDDLLGTFDILIA